MLLQCPTGAMIALLLLGCWFLEGNASVPTFATDGHVYPAPTKVKYGHHTNALDPKLFKPVSIGYSTPLLQRAIDRFTTFPFAYGPGVALGESLPRLSKLLVNVTRPGDSFGVKVNESYHLVINSGNAALVADSPYGALRGLMSFSQVVQFNLTSKTYSVGDIDIADAPRFRYRAVMADTSRSFISLGQLKQMCDAMEFNKFNTLNIHFTDKESWPLEIQDLPLLAGKLSFRAAEQRHIYSLKDCAELVQYCGDRGVRIVPEIDAPGHFSAGAVYPDFFVCMKNDTNGTCTKRGLFDVSNEAGWDFLATLWTSIVKSFPGGLYNIGGDEVNTGSGGWKTSPQILSWTRRYAEACPDDANITCGSVGDVHPYFTRRLVSIIRKIRPDAQIQGWAPGITGFYRYGTLAERYPYVTYLNWNGYDPSGLKSWQSSMAKMTTVESAPVVLSGPYYVVDPKYPHCLDPPSHTLANWEQMMHTDPLNFTASTEAKERVSGGMLTLWGDTTAADSWSLVPKAGKYLVGLAANFWSGNVKEANPDDPFHLSCRGNDNTICNQISTHRCKMLAMTGIGFDGIKENQNCAIEYEPPSIDAWRALRDKDTEIAELRRKLSNYEQLQDGKWVI